MQGLGDAFGQMVNSMMIALIIFVPLGLWKLVEIAVWIVRAAIAAINAR